MTLLINILPTMAISSADFKKRLFFRIAGRENTEICGSGLPAEIFSVLSVIDFLQKCATLTKKRFAEQIAYAVENHQQQ